MRIINKLAKTFSAATVLAMTVYLAPESSIAGIAQGSGRAVNTTDTLYFEIDTSIADTNTDPKLGSFLGAIKNATYNQLETGPFGDETKFNTFKFNPAELKTSLIEDPSELQAINDTDGDFQGKFTNKAVKYEARLQDSKSNFINFEFYAPFTDANSLSVFNASNLNQFLNNDGTVGFPRRLGVLNVDSVLSETNAFFLIPAPDEVTKVPEPMAITGLLGFSILSTALLRKSNRRLER
ncbi:MULTISPECIES: hypothetical protein [Nostocales]|uniref:PEP-CTERM sorting domain-containing protein n=3 Tax=Nostocales TaxID=1161 RepID=A0A8S9TA44_9CYAN|nr:hypothetical protein [Tolypothrix bouteillei]KAF3888464.1 hypothetical protein DA73_0400025505 [Tolypothrix bouteillei VB521301]